MDESSPRRAFFTIISVFLCFTSLLAAETTENFDSQDYHHVILKPPTDLTAYYTGSRSITVGWAPPEVYNVTNHDPGNKTTEEVSDVIANKLHYSLVAMNYTDEVPENSTDSVNETSSDVDNADGNGTDDSSSTSWKCQPFVFFGNYTVELKEDAKQNGTLITVMMKDSAEKKQPMSITDQERIVPFSQGCITHYEVSWRDKESKKPGRSKIISPTLRLADLKNLEQRTTYVITVKAYFVSGDAKESSAINVMTKADHESSVCACDWHGSQTKECQIDKNNVGFCDCKVGYKGRFCEDCAPGYYRTNPFFPCHRCPCDAHATVGVTSCKFVEGFLQCDKCEVGYTGNICHRCDKGYYRYKRYCIPCICNGNTPPGEENTCSPTGKCLNCQRNTTGFSCDKCLPGYEGDPINAKNCTKIPGWGSKPSMDSSSQTKTVVIVVIAAVIVLILVFVGVILFMRYRQRERRRAFWTIEMKRDSDDLDFNTVHNDDAHLDDDDLNFYPNSGRTASSTKYSKLQEDI